VEGWKTGRLEDWKFYKHVAPLAQKNGSAGFGNPAGADLAWMPLPKCKIYF
jgi:hypothetical protein